MKMKKVLAALSAMCMAATAFSAMSFSSTAADEVIGQAYFIGMIGAEGCWNVDEVNTEAGSTVADITGDGTYTIKWVTTAGGTDTVEFLAGTIVPAGTTTNFTTDTFADLQVTLDEVWIDGAQVTDYVVSDAAINTAYYEGTSTGTTRMYLHDDWAGTGVADLPTATSITQEISITFTVSGTGINSEGGADTPVTPDDPDTPDTPEVPTSDAKAVATFMGMIGAAQCWGLEDVAAPSTYAEINGDGTYEVVWDVTGGGTDTVQFLGVQIKPNNGIDNFTTDTYENLAVTLDEVWIDGVQLTDYVVSDAAIDTAYYEGTSAGTTRIYLHDEWAGTGVADLASDTAIGQSVKVVFTVSGMDTASAEGLLGDANVDGKVDATDAAAVLIDAAITGTGGASTLTAEGQVLADVNVDTLVDASDAANILRYAAAVGSGFTGTMQEFLAG